MHCLVVDPSNTRGVHVGTDLGVFVSTDGGASWAVENTGFANVVTEALVLNVAQGGLRSTLSTWARRISGHGEYERLQLRARATERRVAASGSDLTVNVNVTPGGCNWKSETTCGGSRAIGGSGSTSGRRLAGRGQSHFYQRIGTVAIGVAQFHRDAGRHARYLIRRRCASLTDTPRSIPSPTGSTWRERQRTTRAWRR